MSKSVLAEAVETQESVITEEVWGAIIQRVIGHTGNAERCSHICCPREWTDPAGIDAQPVHSCIIYLVRADGPGVMERNTLRLYGFDKVLDWFEIVGRTVFPRPGISAPQTAVGSQNIIKTPRNLIEICRIAYQPRQIERRSGQIRLWHVQRIGKKFCDCTIPALLWNGHTWPGHVR